MNPIPVGSLVRSLVSLSKDSARVADKTKRFSADVRSIGAPMRLIAREVRTISDVGQDFGDVIHAIGEDRSLRLLSRKFPDMTAVENTIQTCRNVLEEIETAISKATKRLATDPDSLNHVVRLTKREREAYGLTDIDLRILYLKVQRAVADLSLQKESLIFADFRTERPSVKENDDENKEHEREIREHEREILYLTQRLEQMTDTLLTLRDRDNMEHEDKPQFTDLNPINGGVKNPRLSDSQDDIDSRPKAGPDLIHRREWNSTPQSSSKLRFSKTPSSNGDKSKALNLTRSIRVADVAGSESFETPESVIGDVPVDLEVWQFSGPITSTSSQKSKNGESCLIPASPEDILALLGQQRKRKTLSALKQYPLLVPEIQDQIHNRIAEKENATGLRWSIASIEIEKPKIYQKWRGLRTESGQIILQGHQRDHGQQPKVLATQPFVMSEDTLKDSDQTVKMSPSYEDLDVRFWRNEHRRTSARSRSDNARNIPYVLIPQHERNRNPKIKRLRGLEDEAEFNSDEDSDDSSGSSIMHNQHLSSTTAPNSRSRGTRRLSWDRRRPGYTKYAEDFRDRGPRSFVASDSGRVDEVDRSNQVTAKKIESRGGIHDPVSEAAVAAELSSAKASERERRKHRRKQEKSERRRQETAQNGYYKQEYHTLPLGGTYPPPAHTVVPQQIEYGEPAYLHDPGYAYPPQASYTPPVPSTYSLPPVATGYPPIERERQPIREDENV